ncbi:MAG: MFS transporter [Psychroflexus halocasei]
MSKKYKFYEYLTENTDSRICKSIPDSDCTHVPKNFTLNVANGSLTKLAEKIISPNLTLAWILSFLSAPVFLIGMLVPIKDVGSLLPQLIVSGKIRSFSIRKNFWTISALVQSFCMLLSGLLVYLYPNQNFTAYLIVFLLLIFSIASGVGSVSFKDVTGKTIPKGQRGQMLSYRSTFGGNLALIAGLILVFFIEGENSSLTYSLLFVLAGILWFFAAILFHNIQEKPGSTKGGRSPIDEVKEGVSIIRKDTNFRNFLITRALLMAIPLLQPFYVVLANKYSEDNWKNLGFLIIISSVAQIISSPIWGRLSDKSSLLVLRLASAIALFGIAYAIYILLSDHVFNFYWILPLFFINALAYAGARLSRKTYLVDYSPEDDRPTYVAMASTVIGLFTLITASFGLITEQFGLLYQFLFFAALLLLCILISLKLKTIHYEN